MLDKIKIDRIMTAVDKMPPLSLTVTKVLQIAEKPNASPKDLIKIISMDPVLTAKVLKLINSAYFGLSNKVTSLANAMIMLGLNTIKNLAISTAVLGEMQTRIQLDQFKSEDFWKHSLGVAVISKKIAQTLKVDKNEIEQYFISGLLHDIGKLIFIEVFPEQYNNILKETEFNQRSLIQTEKALFHYTHCEMGKLLAEKWALGKDNINAIANHHFFDTEPNPEVILQEANPLILTVYLADNICNSQLIGNGGNNYVEKLPEEIYGIMGLNKQSIIQIILEIEETLNKAMVFLKN